MSNVLYLADYRKCVLKDEKVPEKLIEEMLQDYSIWKSLHLPTKYEINVHVSFVNNTEVSNT